MELINQISPLKQNDYLKKLKSNLDLKSIYYINFSNNHDYFKLYNKVILFKITIIKFARIINLINSDKLVLRKNITYKLQILRTLIEDIVNIEDQAYFLDCIDNGMVEGIFLLDNFKNNTDNSKNNTNFCCLT